MSVKRPAPESVRAKVTKVTKATMTVLEQAEPQRMRGRGHGGRRTRHGSAGKLPISPFHGRNPDRPFSESPTIPSEGSFHMNAIAGVKCYDMYSWRSPRSTLFQDHGRASVSE